VTPATVGGGGSDSGMPLRPPAMSPPGEAGAGEGDPTPMPLPARRLGFLEREFWGIVDGTPRALNRRKP